MLAGEEDQYIVYIRFDPGHTERPDAGEEFVAACSSYEEARRVRQEYHGVAKECVIRYVGVSGGGD